MSGTSSSSDMRLKFIKMKKSDLGTYDSDNVDKLLQENFEGGIRKSNAEIIFFILAFFVLFLTLSNHR
jgi:hypothetical protein|tara:strand:- start:7804 stop:8007 length:204 start_codon:yes stop_codon:yes gene_type:complete